MKKITVMVGETVVVHYNGELFKDHISEIASKSGAEKTARSASNYTIFLKSYKQLKPLNDLMVSYLM